MTRTESASEGSLVHGTLDLKAVGDIRVSFIVPAYQRGYRWGREQVEILLEDVKAARGKTYCLQPVVVKALPGDRFEIVDGQQRLTTLYLIYRFMQKEGLKPEPPFSIEYATRPQSGEFLKDPDANRQGDNIDFFHMFTAFTTIRDWFTRQGHQAQLVADDLYGSLGRDVKVIWYQADEKLVGAELFSRLNMGRIPLTDAELIKALFLGVSSDPTPLESRRRLEIGMQWDAMERELHDPGFWAFLTNAPSELYPTRIDLLFELMVNVTHDSRRYQTFFHFKERIVSVHAAETAWNEILTRYAQLKEWHEDPDLYHRIGYLVATGTPKSDDLGALLRASDGQTRRAFKMALDARIAGRLTVSRSELEELTYESGYETVLRTLFLFNVETARKAHETSFEWFPFHAHKAISWSLEHVDAQHSERLNTERQWRAWLYEHATALEALPLTDPATVVSVRALAGEIRVVLGKTVTQELFHPLSSRVIKEFEKHDAIEDVHGIDNLALLPKDANSALGNSVFAVKRRRILELDRAGQYIPVCTRRVFLKYFTHSDEQHMHFWSASDRTAYLTAIVTTLAPYLTPSTEAGGSP